MGADVQRQVALDGKERRRSARGVCGSRAVRVAVVTGLAAIVGACASQPRPLPLRPEPVPYADTLPIEEPEERDHHQELRILLVHAPYEMSEPFRVPEGEALNLTHFDDVVSSAWFERRMGYRDIGPERLARGPVTPGGAPATEGALTVTSAKTEGATPGFVAEDSKGDTYIVKMNAADAMYLQSAAGVIVNRLMWGAGYHVPEDFFVKFDSSRLVVGEDATVETLTGERPMTVEDLETVLAKTRTVDGGRYVALASRYVPGVPKGPFHFVGRRDEDPNDHYRHEYRRELRGLRVISSWVNNDDLREGNTLDVYVEPGYLRHYVIDLATSLGSATTEPKHPKDEAEQAGNFWKSMARLASLGFYRADWEDDPWDYVDPSVGYLRSTTFDPARWNARWENPAFFAMTPADAYWGAKIVAAFSDAHIRAAVEEGGLPERRFVDTLTSILATRRDILVRHWYGEVSPLEEPAVEDGRPDGLTLAFRDLGLDEKLWVAGDTQYRWTFAHDALDREGEGRVVASGSGRQRIDVRWEGDAEGGALDGRDALATLRVRAERPGRDPRAATVWLRWNGRGYEVVGLEH